MFLKCTILTVDGNLKETMNIETPHKWRAGYVDMEDIMMFHAGYNNRGETIICLRNGTDIIVKGSPEQIMNDIEALEEEVECVVKMKETVQE